MRNKGISKGILSGVFWGLDSVILGVALSVPKLLLLNEKGSLLSTLIHDSVSFLLLLTIILYRSKLQEFIKALFSKSGFFVVIAALLGGPLGMGSYILSIKFLGASLASSISAFYPIIGALLAFVFLKNRMKKHSIIGLIVATVAIVLMGYSSSTLPRDMKLGIIFALVCTIGWGSEAVIIDAMLKEDLSSEVALAIRQFTSMITYLIFIFPLIGVSDSIMIISETNITLLIVIAGVLGTISYLNYYKAIDLIGATQAMGLNISYPAWAFIFQYLITKEFNLYHFLLSVIIILGSIMTNDNPKDILKIFNK